MRAVPDRNRMKMRRKIAVLAACAGLMSLSACGEQREIQNYGTAETTTAVTQETTAAVTEETTTAATTAVTQPPLSDFTITDDLVLEAKEDTISDEGGLFLLTNNSDGLRNYHTDYRLVDAETGCQLKIVNPADETEDKTKKIAAGESAEIRADWSERYGRLKGGTYCYELLISMDGESGNRVVCRSEFTVNEAVFTPVLSIDPETVTDHSLTLVVQNSSDCGRSYGLCYRMIGFDANGKEFIMFRVTDTQARVEKNYHMNAGGMLSLDLNWREKFGAMVEGRYMIEIDLLADGTDTARQYRAEFEIVS